MAKKYDFQIYDESESGINHPHFLIQTDKTSSGYGTITVRPVWIRNEKICFYSHINIFKDFQITCQWNLYAHADESYNKPYAYRVEFSGGFNMDSVDETDEKNRQLKKINKELGKLQEKFGASDSFEDFIIRISSILGIDTFVTFQDFHSFGDEIGRNFTAQDAKRYIRSLYTK
jgi:hypothetical protein